MYPFSNHFMTLLFCSPISFFSYLFVSFLSFIFLFSLSSCPNKPFVSPLHDISNLFLFSFNRVNSSPRWFTRHQYLRHACSSTCTSPDRIRYNICVLLLTFLNIEFPLAFPSHSFLLFFCTSLLSFSLFLSFFLSFFHSSFLSLSLPYSLSTPRLPFTFYYFRSWMVFPYMKLDSVWAKRLQRRFFENFRIMTLVRHKIFKILSTISNRFFVQFCLLTFHNLPVITKYGIFIF